MLNSSKHAGVDQTYVVKPESHGKLKQYDQTWTNGPQNYDLLHTENIVLYALLHNHFSNWKWKKMSVEAKQV